MQKHAFGGYAESATTVAWYEGANQVIDFFFSPLWGVVGDRIGRKPLVVLFAIQKAVPIVCLALGAPLWSYLAMDDLSPIPGSISGGVAGAYIADLLVADHEGDADEDEHEDKAPIMNPASAFAYFQAAMFFGEAMGTMVGPYVYDWTGATADETPSLHEAAVDVASGTRGVCIAAASMYVLNVVWCLAAVPESLQPHHEDHTDGDGEKKKGIVAEILKEGNPVGAVRLIRKIGPMVVAFVVLMMSLSLVSQGIDQVKDQYVAIRMGVKSKSLAMLHVYMSIMMVVGNMLLTPVLTKRYGQRVTMYLGVILSVAGLLCLAALTSANGAYVSMTLFCLGSVWNPALQGSIARATPPAKQGKMQAAVAALLALGMAVSPLPFAYLFQYTQYSLPYAVCLVAAAIIIATVVLTFKLIMYSEGKHRYHYPFHKKKLAKTAAAAAREICSDEIPYEILE